MLRGLFRRSTHREKRVTSAIAWPYVIVSLLLGIALPHLHQGPLVWANPLLRQEQVIAFLSAVSSGMMAFTGIVFSLLFIMLQFGSSAYSPHLVGMLSRNKTLTHAGGVFTGTFLYSLMALREVGTLPGGRTPSLTLWVALVWLLGSVFLLLRLVGVFAGLAITEVLEMLGQSGRAAVHRVYGPYASPGDEPSESDKRVVALAPVTQALVHTGKPLYLVGLDAPRLVALAKRVDGVIRVLVAVGDCVSPQTLVATVEGARAAIPEEDLWRGIALARDRTEEQGPKQSMRLLADIALRSLSDAINDPTSAVRALDQLEAILVELGLSDLDVGTVRDEAGAPRVLYPAPTWSELLDLGVVEIQYYGERHVQVDRRLAAMYGHLLAVLPESRRPPVERLAARRAATVERSFRADASLRIMASLGDRQGLGHTFVEG